MNEFTWKIRMKESKISVGKAIPDLLPGAGHTDATIHHSRVQVRPVLVALGPAPLHHCGQHYQQVTLLLPDHVPEFYTCVGQGTLNRYQYKN